ncbi:uncharacterized protein LOC120624604 [Pararge aegeria]|uniref:Jg9773 protein n=1 Tax=Pararge aegeria aegeria TaxID=348720 RepID=A0A8S4RLU6_9NEOP|nr:uncharacterized protein LOC120624604 [Pararge aegeria]CAH2237839.1 jg9773 [Pararge aegeria aegeria]
MFAIIYFLCSLLTSYADLTQYDQRQTGDVNVQVDLKDVQIFAVMKGDKEEYVDYDYAYDYSELTIKPQNRTTPKPHNGTGSTTEKIVTKHNTTIITTVLQEHTIAPINNELTTSGLSSGTIVPDKDESTTTVRNNPDIITEQNIGTIKEVTVAPNHGSTRKNCRKGYVLNQKGQCQLKMNTTENALLRLVKLSQKLKLRRQNKSNDNN